MSTYRSGVALSSAGRTLPRLGLAGRLSSKLPVRFLIGPGLLLVGAGLLLMRGLTATSSWTHLIPGLIVAGVGVGFVNPPLASTAVGVVRPQRAGMASGINYPPPNQRSAEATSPAQGARTPARHSDMGARASQGRPGRHT